MTPYFFDPELRRSIESLLLPEIRLPGQYIGGEVGQIVKPAESVRARLCFCFPDVYSIGMSNIALSVLYDIVNKRPDLACERAFCPYPDMEALLQNAGLPLYSLETFSPLSAFDVVGFTLQYELCYTSVLTTLSLGRIPISRRERAFDDPLANARFVRIRIWRRSFKTRACRFIRSKRSRPFRRSTSSVSRCNTSFVTRAF